MPFFTSGRGSIHSANQPVNCQRENADINQHTGQAAEYMWDIFAAQPATAFIHHQHGDQVAHAAAEAEADGLQQVLVLAGCNQQGAQHATVEGCAGQLFAAGIAAFGEQAQQQPHNAHSDQ